MFLQGEDIHILCLTEHWLKKSELMFSIENYKLGSSFIRKDAIRGGSLILLKNNFKCKERKEIVALSIERTVEISCVELEQYIIICVYRPPTGCYENFESVLEDALKILCKSQKSLILCGDFNINLLDSSSLTSRFLNLLQSFDLSNLFIQPTRITSTSSTCIDNIFCNCNILEKSIICKLRSDHTGQQASFPSKEKSKDKNVTYRPVTSERIAQFKLNICSRLSCLPLKDQDADEMYESFFDSVITEFDKIFTKKTKRSNNKVKFNDWASTGIHKSRSTLYDLYDMKTFIHDENFQNYVRAYSKLFKKVCLTAKSLHLSRKIRQADDKVKTTWKIINTESGRLKSRDNNIVLVNNNNVRIKSDNQVAELFENFFSNIPIATTATLNTCPERALHLLESNVQRCDVEFFFHNITAKTVVSVFKSLKMKNTEDIYGVSIKLLGNIIHCIAPHLAMIFNKCVDEGKFPNLMKCSKILPLFKSGGTEDPSNYRPISILPAISKIFEKILLNQLLCHFNVHNILHDKQYGFTRGRSTTDAGTALMKHIFDAWEKSQNAIGVFCDLSKAFDCVHHSILLSKLEYYGIKNRALDLLSSYLSDRVQRVDINGTKSNGSLVKMGVPQGSILGPFLFLIYINDLPCFVNNFCDIVMFADDTSLIFKTDRRKDNYDEVSVALSQVMNWFSTNNLQLNSKKTKCVKFTLPNVHDHETIINIDGDPLQVINKTVFLGVTVDSKLQWGPHITALAGRLSSAAYAIRKIRQMTDVQTARLVYFSYFHSVMSYGILLWGKAADINNIFVLQKRAIRSIYQLGSRVSLKEKFKEINVLTVASQYIYANIMYVYKNIENFTKKSDVHMVNIRSKSKLISPRYRLTKISESFMGNCIRFFNKIPDDIVALGPNKFKTFVKSKLIKKAYYKISDYINDKNAWL